MQLRPDDRNLLQRIAALANADAPPEPSSRKGGELAAREHRAAWLGELTSETPFKTLLTCFHALEQRGLVEYAFVDGAEWCGRLTLLLKRFGITTAYLARMGFMVRPTRAGWAEASTNPPRQPGKPGRKPRSPDKLDKALHRAIVRGDVNLADGKWKAFLAEHAAELPKSVTPDQVRMRYARLKANK
jgi:hypothetical protein